MPSISEATVDQSAPKRESLFTRSFVLLLITQTCFGMSFSALFLLPKYLKLELGATDVQIGNTGALGSLAGVFAFPFVGALNDRFGRKPFIVLGNVLVTFAALAMLTIREVGPALYALRAVHGVSFALLFNSATTLVSDGIDARKLGRALGVFGASMLATNALSPAIAEPVAQRLGWAMVFWISVAWGVLSIVAALCVREKGRAAVRGPMKVRALSLLGEPRARRVVMLIGAAGAGFGTVFTFHQPYALAVGITKVSGFFVAYAVFALLVRLVLIARVDRLGRREASAISMFVYALAVLGTAFLRPGLLEIIGAVMGLAQGVFYPVFNALAIEGVSAEQRGSMMALYHGGFNGGMALALLAGGAVAEHFGYPALFLSTGVITAWGALSLWRSDFSA